MECGEKNSEQSDLAKDAEDSNDSSGALKHESIPLPTSSLVERLQSICTKKLKNMFKHNQAKQQVFTFKPDDFDELKTFINEEPSSEVHLFSRLPNITHLFLKTNSEFSLLLKYPPTIFVRICLKDRGNSERFFLEYNLCLVSSTSLLNHCLVIAFNLI